MFSLQDQIKTLDGLNTGTEVFAGFSSLRVSRMRGQVGTAPALEKLLSAPSSSYPFLDPINDCYYFHSVLYKVPVLVGDRNFEDAWILQDYINGVPLPPRDPPVPREIQYFGKNYSYMIQSSRFPFNEYSSVWGVVSLVLVRPEKSSAPSVAYLSALAAGIGLSPTTPPSMGCY